MLCFKEKMYWNAHKMNDGCICRHCNYVYPGFILNGTTSLRMFQILEHIKISRLQLWLVIALFWISRGNEWVDIISSEIVDRNFLIESWNLYINKEAKFLKGQTLFVQKGKKMVAKHKIKSKLMHACSNLRSAVTFKVGRFWVTIEGQIS